MSNIRLVGLTSIKIGAITADKSMGAGASIVTVSAIVPDSAHLIIEEPGMTDLFIEESDLPDIQILGTSKKSMEFATRDLGTGILVEAFGGTYTAPEGATLGYWSAPVTAAVIKESCIEAISKTINGKYLKIAMPRVSVKTGGDLRFTKTESGQITFKCDVLIPASSTQIAPIRITETV